MISTKYLIIFAIAIQIVLSQECKEFAAESVTISKSRYDYIYDQRLLINCAESKVPIGAFANLTLTQFSGFLDCKKESLVIDVDNNREKIILCGENRRLQSIIALDNYKVFEIIHNENSYFYNNRQRSSFNISIEIRDVLCARKEAFHCSKSSCILLSSVCNGVDDCEDGKDEIGCERGVFTVDGIHKIRNRAIYTLKSRRTSSWGWRENTHRGIVGLYLAEYNASRNSLEDQLMEKQLELRTSVALFRNETNPISHNELGMIVNALLMICHNPRNFYGYDLIKNLKEQVKISQASAHPMAYLALCNSGELLDENDLERLNRIFNSSEQYLFFLDIQAVAVMVVSCLQNNERFRLANSSFVIDHYISTIHHFKELQKKDGSFGNVYTTALITQALLSSGQETSRDWNLVATVKYLVSEVESSKVDFLTMYLALPILNGKSLPDIAKYSCVNNPNSKSNRSVDDIQNKLGSKMTVHYELYFGDNKDAIHTLSVRVPENITAHEIMQVAEVTDSKYKFQSKVMFNKLYIYEISGITNDPEAGKFWILYLKSEKADKAVAHYTEGPDELEMYDGDHLIMWYRTTDI